MKNKRFGVMSLMMMLVLTLALTACTKDEAPKNNAGNDKTNGASNGVEEPGVPNDEKPDGDTGNDGKEEPTENPKENSNENSKENPKEDPDNNAKDDPKDAAKTAKQGTGIYKGQMDSHSIEIETADGPTPFQLADGMEAVLEKLTEEDPVTFEYVEKAIEGDDTVKQLVLTKLEKAASK
ncbi:hypothetical protein [Paenibacillus spongiae]|uniref:Lipoprotein n=1 Tax=Paenibacillus spongiae TaxID=2909671 RepID=A0ABY5S6N4_9BACL|nr:hypothetical protein [Paenibacillus spongiae]UVI29571.1 hypothetical protein L1F29_29845 [Paenibacillus spongiae]